MFDKKNLDSKIAIPITKVTVIDYSEYPHNMKKSFDETVDSNLEISN